MRRKNKFNVPLEPYVYFHFLSFLSSDNVDVAVVCSCSYIQTSCHQSFSPNSFGRNDYNNIIHTTTKSLQSEKMKKGVPPLCCLFHRQIKKKQCRSASDTGDNAFL